MKKWLAALFLYLLLLPCAMAEELDATPQWLAGVWRFDGGAEVCGYGFRMDADGAFTCFTTDDFENFPPERLIPIDRAAIWRYENGTLSIISEEGVFSYPLSISPERGEMNGCDTIHLQEGDGGGFYRRGEERHLVALQSPVPQDVLYHIESFHPDYRLEGFARLADTPMGDVCFSLIRCEHGRMLHGFRREGSGWVNFLDTAKAIPQIDMPDVRLSVSKESRSYDSLWYYEGYYDYTYPEGPTVSIVTTNGEYTEEYAVYVIERDGLHLVSYGDNPNCQIDVLEDGLVFYNISFGMEGIASTKLDTNILSVDFYALPRHVTDVMISGSGEPHLPESSEANALSVQDVTLREGKYPVYMGPGKEFGRAAQGKAAVSTNGWVQVFGEYDGWLLIHYAISDAQYRFGWITTDALAKGETAEALPLTFGDYMMTEEEIDLMDDPLNSRTALLTLPAETDMERLAQLGEIFSLVRVETDGEVHWGFVYSWPLGHG